MNAESPPHPTDQLLCSYGLGKLDDSSASAVSQHLERCAECRQRVGAISSDSFLGRLQKAREVDPPLVEGASLLEGPLSLVAGRGAAVPPPDAGSLPAGLAENLDYQVKRELGRGGMGVVYLAHNVLMGRDEVLKVMGREIMEKPRVFERFQREIRAVAKLRHENIVTAYTAFRIEGGLVFAMEYVEGLDLSRLVKVKGPLSVMHAAYFSHQAALGLQHAHERGMVHRDIKPHNLMLTHNGKARIVKILDFGLAKASREQSVDSSLTNEGQALGTPDYIAPEQILNATDVDIRADLYSLGGTLYFLLTGRPPFRGNSLYDIYQAHISRDADLLNLIRPEVPAELAALVAKLLAKEPRRRFQSPAEVAEALKPFFKKGYAPFQSQPAAPAKPAAPARSTPVRQEPEPRVQAPPSQPPSTSEPGPAWTGLVAISEEESLVPKSSPRPLLPIEGSRKGPLALAGVALLSLGILAVLALGLIRVKTPVGTIVLEGLPENAVVEVDDQPVPNVTIRKTPEGAPYLTLSPTRHGVRVKTADGKEIVSRDLTIEDGTTEVLHIWQEMTEEDRQAALTALNQRAWDLATDPNGSLRNGPKAVDLAMHVCQLDGYKTSLYLDSLAAACAEAGRFEDAVRWQTKAVEQHADLPGLDRYQGRLQLYRTGKPYHRNDMLPAPDPLLAETGMTLNDRAWQLATAADATLRDGNKAVEAATLACEKVNYRSPSYLDTLAAALAEAGRFDEAVKREIEAIAKSDPSASTSTYRDRLELYQARKPYHQGDPLPETVRGGLAGIVPPEDLDSLNRQAWELATSPDPARRDGMKARALAIALNERTGYRSSRYLDTLAAACAEAGLFTEAVKRQEAAIQQYGDLPGLDRYQSRLDLYKAGKPYREDSLPPGASGRSRPFLPLFPGKDLAGWTKPGDSNNDWSIDPDSGDLVVKGTGDPRKRGFLVSGAEFDNFRLSFQFASADQDFDTAIAFRALPEECNNPDTNPLRVKIFEHTQYPNARPGILMWTPLGLPEELIPLDHLPSRSSSWNDMTIEVRGPDFRVSVNGDEVSHIDLSTLVDRPHALPALKRASGRIAIQAHTGTVRFRNMQIQSLNDEAQVSTERGSGRFPVRVLSGEWVIEGEELVETKAVRDRGAVILFGDPSLSAYNFRFKARSTGATHGFKAVFHAVDVDNFCVFAWGNYFNEGSDVSFVYQGQWGRDDRLYRPGAIDLSRWYDVRIEVRGSRFQCYIDDDLIFEHTDDRFTHGQIGLSTWDTGARFKDIAVTSADGKQVLLAGLPGI